MIEYSIKNIDQLILKLNSYANNFIFRGHGKSSWQLETTLERVLGSNYFDKAGKMEEYSLDNFKSTFHLYDKENLTPNSELQWLAIMQHYGVPTRLLDFTTSPYVALYFALEYFERNQVDDISIFSIDYRALLNASIEFIKSKDKDFNFSYNEVLFKQDEIFTDIITRFSYDILWITEPKILNARIDKQAGTFLVSGNNSLKIDQLLGNAIYSGVTVEKLLIDKTMIDQVFILLQKVNINSKTIYGDLSGLARSIKMFMTAYN